MSHLSLSRVSYTWGGPLLLDEVDLEIGRGERIGLLGRNGAGKSTLMRILAGEIDPDDGEILRKSGLRVARLEQEVPQNYAGSVAEIVAEGFAVSSGENADESDVLIAGGSHSDNWEVDHAVERVLSRMKLDGNAVFETLSSGMKRRALLAKALVAEPEILLLDEPTNHLDIESIAWLERFLKGYDGTLLFVTHDRVFLQALATRIIEIDRGRLFDWTCGYSTFLKRKQAALDAEEQQNRHFDRKLAEEEVWIRQGIKARRTRNEGRVRALKKMREEHQNRRRQIGNVRMQAVEAERSGRLVIEAKNVSFAYGDLMVVDDYSTLITRGDRIGIIGPNGSGKTTLLKLLLGDLEPAAGTIRHGTRLQVVYFDQLREQIEEEKTVVENVGEGRDMLEIGGKQKHIYGYLQDFLFTPERARRPARFLSGGERNRLLLAKLFTRPSNVIVLDEPTNDLDTETLELLEELVTNYAGTLLLVSHDRAFLNNVVTSTLVFEGDGQIKEYAGGYDDYLRACQEAVTSAADTSKPAKKPKSVRLSPGKPARLNYNEQRELESLPKKIDELEQQQSELHTTMAAPAFFKLPGSEIANAKSRLDAIERELSELYVHWEQLEARG
jgi:ATP-binding cassette subfamily F protein uup